MHKIVLACAIFLTMAVLRTASAQGPTYLPLIPGCTGPVVANGGNVLTCPGTLASQYLAAGAAAANLGLGTNVATALTHATNSVSGVAVFDGSGNIVTPGPSVTINNAFLLQDSSGTGFIRDTSGTWLGYGATNVLHVTSAGVASTLGVSAPTFSGGGAAVTGILGSNVSYVQAGTGGATITAQAALAAIPVTPQQFGAACDGNPATDDAVFLQLWLNALGTVSVSNSPVYAGFIPGGTCSFKSALIGPATNAISIYGSGLGSQLRYTGAATTTTALKFGTTNGSCSSQSLSLSDFLLSSATTMTTGSALELDDTCAVRISNVAIEDNAGGAVGNWANGLTVKGGNQVYLLNDTISGSVNAAKIFGDDVGHSSRQLTDPRVIGGIFSGGVVGFNVAGNVGGLTLDDVDLLGNNTELKISQDGVAIPNLQIVLGPTMFIDATNGGAGRGIDIEDAGGSASILMLQGTWLASAGTDCMYIAAGASNWNIQWSGGKLINCGTNGINNQSSSVLLNVSDLIVNMTAAGFGGNSGYGLLCQSYDINAKFSNIDFQSVTGSGPYSSNCFPRSYTLNGNQSVYSDSPSVNVSPPLTFWQFDTSGQASVTINNTSNALLPVGSGLVAVTNQTNGETALYMCGGTSCTLAVSTGSTWAASSNAPAGGKMSVAYDGSSAYRIYNNTGSNVNTNIMLLKTRNSV